MASTYKRADSPFIWIRYKSDSGPWKSANIGGLDYFKEIARYATGWATG
jgi:hypothetical protein